MTSNNQNGNSNSDVENRCIERNISSLGLISNELQATVQKIQQNEEDLKNAAAKFSEKEVEYQRQINEESIRIKDLEKENEELKKSAYTYEIENQRLTEENEELKKAASTNENKYMQMEENLNDTRNSLVKSELRRNEYKEQLQKSLSEVKEHQREVSELTEVKNKLTASEARLNSEIKHLKDERNANQDTISQLKDKENQLNLENKDLKEKNDNLEHLLCQNQEQQRKDTAMIEELQKQQLNRQQIADCVEEFIANQRQNYTAKIRALEEEIKVLKEKKLSDEVSKEKEIWQYSTENEALKRQIQELTEGMWTDDDMLPQVMNNDIRQEEEPSDTSAENNADTIWTRG